MNLLALDGPGARQGGYVVSGSWGKKALADAKLVSDGAYTAWSGAGADFARMPSADELEIVDGSRFLHVTSNETIGGIRLPEFFDVEVQQVADMSSDYLTRAIPWDRFDVVYGGAQKNLGPAGLTVVFVRDSVLADVAKSIPSYLRYETHTSTDSLANTPPVFAIWATGKVLAWIKANGGVAGMEQRAQQRSAMVYDAIDGSDGFFISPVDHGSRSHTNVVFRLGGEDLEQRFLAGAEEQRLTNLKGHRSVGGVRASIYNALPTESVKALVDFMGHFAGANG
jgi:phosphoserine aminotransferase